MPSFSDRSRNMLSTCHPLLIRLFSLVVVDFDCAVVSGHRGQEEQDELLRAGKTHLGWPHSKHNTLPSRAVDVYPYPIDWQDHERMCFFAGYVLGMARELKTLVCWGGDWDMDMVIKDNRFDDLGHFELVDLKEVQ